MRTRVLVFLAISLLVLVTAKPVLATNGDNLIGIGPIARSMGGVGIAAPQDAISAVFANPAAMCFGPYCPSTEVDFAGTLFMPHPKSSVVGPGGGSFSASADEKVYTIPAIGLSYPLSNTWPYWRFGLAAYGVTGLGVDYRNTALDRPGFYQAPPLGPSGAPLVSGSFTNLQILKFAPAIAAQPTERLSLGLAVHVDYGSLDLGEGSAANYGIGVQIGGIYKLTDNISLGLDYVSPQTVDYNNVAHLDALNPTAWKTLSLESPQQVGIGLSYTTLENKLLVEGDVKWINWSNATGYSDFDWKDQWVLALGAQYFFTPQLSLRAGYNYGNNPVRTHDNFNGTTFKMVQGSTLPNYFYETFRIVGFPAIVEHHLTAGIGYQFSPKVSVYAGYMHAFSNSIEEHGTDLFGTPTTLKSTLSEDSVDVGLTWRF